MLVINQQKHAPLHIYSNEHLYFLTARCVEKFSFWNTDEKKKIFVSVLNKSIQKFDIRIYAWVLLNNHYHCLFQTENYSAIGRFVNNLHSNSCRLLNNADGARGRMIWYQYWDYCIRNQHDFWKHFNYIIQNPVKHGLVKSLEEAYHYKFSSNPVWLERFGQEGLDECFMKYRIRDWTPTIVED